MCHNSITGGPMNFILGSQHQDDTPTSEAVNASEMTYIVSSGALNSTHSLRR